MNEQPVKMKYPNLPDDFPDLVRERRERLGISAAKMAKDHGWSSPTVWQLETRRRNFSYERAKQIVAYLKMDYDLPIPDPSMREELRRPRNRYPVQRDSFFVEVDGEIIHVLTYRKLGPIAKAVRTEP